MSVFTMEVQGLERVINKYKRLAYAAIDTKPAMEIVALRLMEIEAEIFETEGEHSGRRWKEIDPDWWFRKYHEGYDTRIMHRTHDLRNSMTIMGSKGQILQVGNRNVTLGSSIEYAAEANSERPFNKLTKVDTMGIRKIIGTYLINAFNTGGGGAK